MIKQYIRFSMDIISFYAPCVALQHEQLPLNGNLTDLRLGKLCSPPHKHHQARQNSRDTPAKTGKSVFKGRQFDITIIDQLGMLRYNDEEGEKG